MREREREKERSEKGKSVRARGYEGRIEGDRNTVTTSLLIGQGILTKVPAIQPTHTSPPIQCDVAACPSPWPAPPRYCPSHAAGAQPPCFTPTALYRVLPPGLSAIPECESGVSGPQGSFGLDPQEDGETKHFFFLEQGKLPRDCCLRSLPAPAGLPSQLNLYTPHPTAPGRREEGRGHMDVATPSPRLDRAACADKQSQCV